ncbi:MAG: SWIM zinc finger family protein, partial [Methylovulum sp.]
MNDLKKLLDSDIRYECGDGSFERGKSYYAKGMVLNLTVNSEGALFVQINATVNGAASNPYKQNIRIIWRPDYSSAEIEGNCSCPVGYNCKHVAAVCLKFQAASEHGDAIEETGSNCLDWLDTFSPKAPQPAGTYQEFIAYILKPGKNAQEFSVDFLITKHKKSGGLSKGRKTNLINLRYSYSYLNYIQPQDEEIAKLLTALNNLSGSLILGGTTGYILLSKLLQTGRLFWQVCEGSPLQAGATRDLRFDWQQSAEGDYQLIIATEPPATLLLTEPPQYLDTEMGVIGAVEAGSISAEQLKKLLEAPLIPEKYADEFSQRLTIEHPELPLPSPKKIALTDLDDLSPTPVLLLSGNQLTGSHYRHFLTLNFRYGDWLLTSASEPYSTIKTGQGLVRIKRDTAYEHQAA